MKGATVNSYMIVLRCYNTNVSAQPGELHLKTLHRLIASCVLFHSKHIVSYPRPETKLPISVKLTLLQTASHQAQKVQCIHVLKDHNNFMDSSVLNSQSRKMRIPCVSLSSDDTSPRMKYEG